MTIETDGGDRLLTGTQAARYLGDISQMTIWRWTKNGIIPPPLKINGRKYWYKSSLDEAIGARTYKPEASQ